MFSESTDIIETVAIHTSIDAFDRSSGDEVIKLLGFNFEWDECPGWLLEDGIGISHTGTALGLTDLIDKGGYIYDTSRHSINPEWSQFGITAKFDLNPTSSLSIGQYGRVNFKIGNVKTAVTSGYFSIYGRYGHLMKNIDFDIILSSGGVDFEVKSTNNLVETSQIYLNRIRTY